MDEKLIISQKIKVLLDQRGWSRRELARQLGVSLQSVLAYIDGTTLPNPDNRAAIARLMGISPQELEAELFKIRMDKQTPTEQICADIRSMSIEDFLEVRRCVNQRERELIEAIASTSAEQD